MVVFTPARHVVGLETEGHKLKEEILGIMHHHMLSLENLVLVEMADLTTMAPVEEGAILEEPGVNMKALVVAAVTLTRTGCQMWSTCKE